MARHTQPYVSHCTGYLGAFIPSSYPYADLCMRAILSRPRRRRIAILGHIRSYAIPPGKMGIFRAFVPCYLCGIKHFCSFYRAYARQDLCSTDVCSGLSPAGVSLYGVYVLWGICSMLYVCSTCLGVYPYTPYVACMLYIHVHVYVHTYAPYIACMLALHVDVYVHTMYTHACSTHVLASCMLAHTPQLATIRNNVLASLLDCHAS